MSDTTVVRNAAWMVAWDGARHIYLRDADLAFAGADISEVAPCYDPTGITCVTAANLMFEILCVMAAGHLRTT